MVDLSTVELLNSFLLICISFAVRVRGIVCVFHLLFGLANYKELCKWCKVAPG